MKNRYDKEFKQMAVELCNSGRIAREVAKELGIAENLLSRWRQEYRKYGKNSFAGRGKIVLTDEQKEIKRLNKALKESEIEREILKKAVSIFSRSDTKNLLS